MKHCSILILSLLLLISSCTEKKEQVEEKKECPYGTLKDSKTSKTQKNGSENHILSEVVLNNLKHLELNAEDSTILYDNFKSKVVENSSTYSDKERAEHDKITLLLCGNWSVYENATNPEHKEKAFNNLQSTQQKYANYLLKVVKTRADTLEEKSADIKTMNIITVTGKIKGEDFLDSYISHNETISPKIKTLHQQKKLSDLDISRLDTLYARRNLIHGQLNIFMMLIKTKRGIDDSIIDSLGNELDISYNELQHILTKK